MYVYMYIHVHELTQYVYTDSRNEVWDWDLHHCTKKLILSQKKFPLHYDTSHSSISYLD